MAEAARRHNHSPVKQRRLPASPWLYKLLLYAPIRIGNLASARIGENLTARRSASTYWLVFPELRREEQESAGV